MSVVVPPAGNGLAPDGAMRLLLDLEAAGACTPVALDLSAADLSWERYVGVLVWLGTLHKRMAWYTGDALNYGERHFGEEMAQAVSVLGMSERTLINRRWVCANVPPARRVPELSFSHHDAVAALGPREQRRWLREALEQKWSRERLREALRDADALPRSGRVALGEAQANATQRLTTAARGVLGAARREHGGWWVPDEAWAALVEAV